MILAVYDIRSHLPSFYASETTVLKRKLSALVRSVDYCYIWPCWQNTLFWLIYRPNLSAGYLNVLMQLPVPVGNNMTEKSQPYQNLKSISVLPSQSICRLTVKQENCVCRSMRQRKKSMTTSGWRKQICYWLLVRYKITRRSLHIPAAVYVTSLRIGNNLTATRVLNLIEVFWGCSGNSRQYSCYTQT